MKKGIFKISVVILLIMTLTMTNFIFLGSSLISYAADATSTNNKNIEFEAYFKDDDGQATTTLERTADMQEISLYLAVNVKTEGFFVGQIALSNSNFNIVSSESEYVSSISDNIVYLNQLDVGTTAEIEVIVEPIDEEVMNIDMLDIESELTLTGIYRDNTEKDINIDATRTVTMQLAESNTNENVKNEIQVITNKIIKIDGEDKRIVQLSLSLGLQDNNYPIKEIYTKINAPEISGLSPEVMYDVNLNTMSAFDYKYENGYVEITLTNEVGEDDTILWERQGEENIILTYIYDASVTLDDVQITTEETVTLQNDKQLTSNAGTVTLSNEEIDSTIGVTVSNSEESIYKGKLYSGIDKQYTSETTLDINLANIEEYIYINEEASRYISENGEVDSNIYYNKTTISKETFDNIFGAEGTIEIYNEDNELLATITSETEADDDGNIVIDYTDRNPKAITIKTSQPINEGSLTFTHTKTIGASDSSIVSSATSIATKIVYGYNNYSLEELAINGVTYTTGIESETEISMGLNETVTETRLELSRNTLSTVVSNDIEIKLILKTDEESRDLYKNPTFTIELPEQVESIDINSINVLYEEELSIANYTVDGRYITIQMEGEQTSYKSQSVEGANIIIDATVHVNKTSIAQPESINVTYTNEKANAYSNNEEIGRVSQEIEVVAPKDVTAINTIEALDVETIGEDEETSVSLQRGTDAIQMEVTFEIINNNEEDLNNVYILGTFPTKTDTEENNIDIEIIDGISIENATVYYTENEDATADLEDEENAWTEELTSSTEVKKYLIVMDSIASRTLVGGSYTIEVPQNLEYNQTATEGYAITYTNAGTGTESTVSATDISMETGVGPKLETSISATVGGEELTSSSIVRNGEVIKYCIEVSNVGSEDVSDIAVTGNIPDGTVLVEPVDNYEYTGASYYTEVETNAYGTTIESLAVGEVTYVEYEVMVESDLEEGTSITGTAEINFSDVVQETNELTVTSGTGTLRAMVKRVTDRTVDLYESGTVAYYGIVKNTTSETINNVTVQTNKSDSLQVSRVTIISGVGEDEVSDDDIYIISSDNVPEVSEDDESYATSSEVTSEEIEYSDEINIGTLEPGESKIIEYIMEIGTMPADTDTVEISIVASDGTISHRSNQWIDTVNSFDIEMSMEANTEDGYVKSGDNIIYTIRVNNTSESSTNGLTISDAIPSQLTVQSVTVNGEETDITSNNVEITEEVEANSEMEIVIETVVDYVEGRTEAETITNMATASIYGEEVAETSAINHVIAADVEDDDENTTTGTDTDDGESGNIANGTQMISGYAWYDEDNDGRKSSSESTLSGITVRLLNVETNQLVRNTSGNVLEATTNSNGMYVLENLSDGQYIVIFDYDESTYSLTTYQADGVSDSENSNARTNELLIEGEKQEVASTDIISIESNNVSNINIGLIDLQTFDLKLDKYISRIITQNSTSGTTTREYTDTTTAKIELSSKEMSGTNVVIEYEIVVTNVGEVAGYARSIVDYLPSDLEFSADLNSDWYLSGNYLYTTALSNEIINPGESKTVTLTLTKTMGEDNLVTRNNAEIYEAYNNQGLDDINSTPGNNVSGENDIGYADVIISVKTGTALYISIGVIVAILVVAGVTAGIIVKRKNSKEEE